MTPSGTTTTTETTTIVPTGQLQWLIPIAVGAHYGWQLRGPWNLDIALATGPLLQIVQAHGVDVPSSGDGPAPIMAWHIRVSAGLSYRLGPGVVGLHLGAAPVVLTETNWTGPSATFEAAAGYTGRF